MRRNRYVSLASMFVCWLLLKIQHGARLATSNLIGSLLTYGYARLHRFSSHWIVSVVNVVIVIVRKTKPSDPYDYDALTTTVTSTIVESHQVLTLLTTTITTLV